MPLNPWVALEATTDRRAHALALARAHHDALSGGRPARLVRDVIRRSWRRSASAGLDPEHGVAPRALTPEEAQARWERHPLSAGTDLLRDLLEDVRADAGQVVLVCDADGTLLWIDGEPALLEAAAEVNLTPGGAWAESAAGTNAMGTALAAEHPVQVFSAEHFAEPVHGWTCSAAPVHDPRTGRPLGVIDLSGELSTAHPHSLALVSAAARMLEAGLRRELERASSPAPVLVPARVARDGLARLEVLGRDRGVLALGSRRVELTPRQSEIVLLLAARPEGLTAEQLAIELYGDFGKPVSVRAALSRLRPILGPLLEDHPYRLAAPLQTDADELERMVAGGRAAHALDRYAGPLLPRSEVPAVVELRERLDHGIREAVLRAGDAAQLTAWLATPSGRDDLVAVRRLVELEPEQGSRRTAALSRLRRLTGGAA